MRNLLLMLSLCVSLPMWGQFYPSSASTRVYLGHLVDGGPASQKWIVTVIVGNPNADAPAPVRISFYNDSGQPLPLNFGQGASAVLNFTVPAGGVKILNSLGASPTAVQGWAILETPDAPNATPPVYATPVTATVLFKATQAGGQVWDVASPGTGSTHYFYTYANGDLGVALANPNAAATINLQIAARNEDGTTPGGPWPIRIPPLNHRAFNLYGPTIGLPRAFSGHIAILSTDATPSPFVALALNFRDPVLSPLPPGEMSAPAPYERRPYDVGLKARQAGSALMMAARPYMDEEVTAEELAGYVSKMGLAVDIDTSIKASYNAADNNIHLSTSLVEMLGTNDAALAFIIAHMSAHGVMRFIGVPESGPFTNDAEGLADAVAAGTLLRGGFDPGGAADFFARLVYADKQGLTIDNPLRVEFGLPNGMQARLQKLWSFIDDGCDMGKPLYDICQTARKYWHPHNPLNVP